MSGKFQAYFMKYRVLIISAALVNMAIIVVRSEYWLGAMGYHWLMFWLIITGGVLATYAWFSHNTKSVVKSSVYTILGVILILGIILGGIRMSWTKPQLSASEVKTVVSFKLSSSYRVISVEHLGWGDWQIRVLSKDGLGYLIYQEWDSDLFWDRD